MTKKEREHEERIAGLLDSWNQHTKPDKMAEPDAPAEIVEVLGKIVNTYAYGHDEIEILLKSAFTRVIALARAYGYSIGQQDERQTNPAIKSAGACVKAARDEERRSLRETLRTVYDAEVTRGTNPYYAFNEALKAIE